MTKTRRKPVARSHKRRGAAAAEEGTLLLERPRVSVAYPGENETISHPEYTMQVATSEPASSVEVRVDQGDWRACREALGLWWYDWNGYGSGEHEVVARRRGPDGETETSEPRSFFVKGVEIKDDW